MAMTDKPQIVKNTIVQFVLQYIIMSMLISLPSLHPTEVHYCWSCYQIDLLFPFLSASESKGTVIHFINLFSILHFTLSLLINNVMDHLYLSAWHYQWSRRSSPCAPPTPSPGPRTCPECHHTPGSSCTRASNQDSRRFHNHWEGPYLKRVCKHSV